MAIGFYFSGAGGSVKLPVNPPSLQVKYQGNNQRTEVVALGEINILRDRKLSSISMDFLLPGHSDYPFITGTWKQPSTIVKYFRSAMENKKPVRFVVSEFGLNIRMSVETVTEERAAGDHDSVNCSLSLLQYRSYGASVLVIPPTTGAAGTSSGASRESDKPENKTYTVKSGDCLWNIAQRELGNGSRYNEIASLNGISNPNLIYAGTTLQLPAR